MLTITSNEQAVELIKDGVLAVDDDIEIAFDGFSIRADIKCRNIYSKDKPRDIEAFSIDAGDINTGYIYATNIHARDISAGKIHALNIKALDIKAWNIDANNITAKDINTFDINANNIYAFEIEARNIEANNIEAKDISYNGVCFAYKDLICTSIKGRVENSRHFSLNGEVIIKEEKK